MTYTPPDGKNIDFDLDVYSPVSQNDVNFNVADEYEVQIGAGSDADQSSIDVTETYISEPQGSDADQIILPIKIRLESYDADNSVVSLGRITLAPEPGLDADVGQFKLDRPRQTIPESEDADVGTVTSVRSRELSISAGLDADRSGITFAEIWVLEPSASDGDFGDISFGLSDRILGGIQTFTTPPEDPPLEVEFERVISEDDVSIPAVVTINDPEERGGLWGAERGGQWSTEAGRSWGPQYRLAYRVKITTADGRRIDLRSVIDVDLTYNHTSISDVEVTIPHIEGLDAFRFGRMEVYYGATLLFNSLLEYAPGASTQDEAQIGGRGVSRDLTRGHLQYRATDSSYHEAIRDVWENHTSFNYQVLEPNEVKTFEEYEQEGTPMEILKDLHDLAGMRFTVQHFQPGKQVESYDPDNQVRPANWTSVDWDSEVDVTDYANHVVVRGGIDTDTDSRYTAEAEDMEEIERVGQRITWPVDDITIESEESAQERAENVLQERIQEDSFGGTIDIIPQIILPGYAREIEEFQSQDAEEPPVIPIDEVNFSESSGEALATLSIDAPDGLIDVVSALMNRQPTIEREAN